MAKIRNQDFLRGSDTHQERVLTVAAIIVIVTTALVVAGMVWVVPRFETPSGLPLSIDVPYVGPGVGTGTKVMLHGVEVGEVTALQRTTASTVRMSIRLNSQDIVGLTDAFDVDFQPQNYFGISAVGLMERPGGASLVAGRALTKTPIGDFTMSTMLEKGSTAVDGTLTQSMIDSLNKVVQYTDGLTPLIQSGIVFADRVAATQVALPTELLGYVDDILGVLPAFSGQAIDTLVGVYDSQYNRRPDGSTGVDDAFMDKTDKGLGLAANSLFGKAGRLLASHGAELTPATQLVQALTDAMPHILDNGALPSKVSTLIDRYNAAFTQSGGRTTLNLRLVLDALPMIAAPLALTGVPALPTEGDR
ncbi:Mce family protein [Nocardia sp. NPDC004860]|uniref:Mce family protein n=1 Tax=Nocardia sp. NPDC004860 TaxID=3154557 RepID=UPI00339F7D8C